jgi:hypothetical protein
VTVLDGPLDRSVDLGAHVSHVIGKLSSKVRLTIHLLSGDRGITLLDLGDLGSLLGALECLLEDVKLVHVLRLLPGSRDEVLSLGDDVGLINGIANVLPELAKLVGADGTEPGGYRHDADAGARGCGDARNTRGRDVPVFPPEDGKI